MNLVTQIIYVIFNITLPTVCAYSIAKSTNYYCLYINMFKKQAHINIPD